MISSRGIMSAHSHPHTSESIVISAAKWAASLLQQQLELAALLHGTELIATANTLAVDDGIRDSRTAGELAKNLLDVTVVLLAARVQFHERVVHAGSVQRILAVGRVRSVGFAEDEQSACTVCLDLLEHKGALGLLRELSEVLREQTTWHI